MKKVLFAIAFALAALSCAFFAACGQKSYDVIFVSEGKEVLLPAFAGDIVTLPDCVFIKEDCRFLYWTDGKDVYYAGEEYTVPQSSVTFTAVWEGISYSVGFEKGLQEATGEPLTMDGVKPNENITMPRCPYSAKGYSFVGWTDGKEVYAEGESYTMPEQDVVFTALWEKTPVWYTVKFFRGEEEIKEAQTVEEGGFAVKPDDPMDENMTFLYWADERGKKFDFSLPVADHVNLHAVFRIVVSFSVGKGSGTPPRKEYYESAPDKYSPFCLPPKSEDMQKQDCEFVGWTDGAGVYRSGEPYPLTKSVLFTAVWTNTFLLTLSSEDGQETQISFTGGENFTLPACPFERLGYLFLGWQGEKGEFLQAGTEYKMPDHHFSLSAKWEFIGLILSASHANGELFLADIRGGESVGYLTVYGERDEQVWFEYRIEEGIISVWGGLSSVGEFIDGKINLLLVYEGEDFIFATIPTILPVVEVNLGEGSGACIPQVLYNERTFDYTAIFPDGEGLTPPQNMIFLHWEWEGKAYRSGDKVILRSGQNALFVAVWTYPFVEVSWEELVGKAFAGEESEAESASDSFFQFEGERNKKYLTWMRSEQNSSRYQMLFCDGQGGLLLNREDDFCYTASVGDFERILKVRFKRIEGKLYAYIGYFGDMESNELSQTYIFGETELHEVTFLSDKERITLQTPHGKRVKPPQEPTKKGMVFVCWLDETGREFDFSAPVLSDRTVTAYFCYRITFDFGEGEAESVTYEESFILTATPPEREGYTFVGWLCGDKIYRTGDRVTELTATFVAIWEKEGDGSA